MSHFSPRPAPTDDGAEILIAAAEQHDPSLEPYASMTREQLQEMMARETDLARWAMLEQFLIDTFSRKELETHNRAQALARFLIEEWDAWGDEQCVYLCGLAGEMAVEICKNMPPIGPAHECN